MYALPYFTIEFLRVPAVDAVVTAVQFSGHFLEDG